MARKRDAIDTIIGYYYQFDYFILQLLALKNNDDIITIEGIEDVDITKNDETTAIQCKYYDKTEYNHSVIAKPIRLMLKDYAERLLSNNIIRYKLYGRYKSGHDKFPDELSVEFVKENFFTYTDKGKKHVLHNELSLTDKDIKSFLDNLVIDIYAEKFDEQQAKVINGFQEIFHCSDFEAEYYYYNNALRLVKNLATKQSKEERTIPKCDFLNQINCKQMLFDTWYIQFKGEDAYCKAIKKQYFTQHNISPCERFFLIECDKKISNSDLAKLIITISEKWSKLSKREPNTFCPYVLLEGISQKDLISVKKLLSQENMCLWDGYDFLGADFSVNSILRKANSHNQVNVKIINNIDNLNTILSKTNDTRKIYEFYLENPFWKEEQYLYNGIQIPSTDSIRKMI